MDKLSIKILVDDEVGIADDRVCWWARRKVFFARSEAQEGVSGVYTS